MKDRQGKIAKGLIPSLVIMAAFWTLAVVMWRSSGHIFFLFNFMYIGTAIGVGMGVYSLLPRNRKSLGRRLTLLLVGGYMVGFLGLWGRENMQIEGLFFYLLAGVVAGAVMHYAIAKIAGPLLFGRGWCGWGCWTAMVLDLLPYPHSSGRLAPRWGWLRCLHFLLSLGLVLFLWFGLEYRLESVEAAGLYWMLGGNALYHLVGIGLAVYLKDNRAFCKYVCPITVFLKLTSRFSLLKVAGDSRRCSGCGVCVKVCPMDIRIPAYIRAGQRVLSTECIFCHECVTACPVQALKVSFGLDAGGREFLQYREEPDHAHRGVCS